MAKSGTNYVTDASVRVDIDGVVCCVRDRTNVWAIEYGIRHISSVYVQVGCTGQAIHA